MFKTIFPLAIAILFAAVSGFPLLHKGLIPTHDGEYHVVRFYEFNKTLLDGDWYPRWAADLNNGFGVPLFNFVYPLPNFIAVFFHLFGISFIDSFKLEMFTAILLSAVFFYLWAKEFWGRLGGIVSSVFYTFSPYHFVDIYIRGSVGEVWALAFFPAFLWSYTRFVNSKKGMFMVLSSLFLALIIFSHNILALMFFFFAFSYIAFLIYREKTKQYLVANSIYIVLLGLGLSAIFWLPAILEKDLVRGLEIFDVSSHFPEFYQLLIPSWGSGFSGGNLDSELSFQVGIANLIAVFLSLFFAFFARIKRREIIFFIVWFFLVFFLILGISKPIWQFVPLMKYFQFPWRLLSLEILIASFLAGSLVHFWKAKFFAFLLIAAPLFLGAGYIKPAYYLYRNDNYYISRPNFIGGTNSPGNVFNTVFFGNPKKEKDKAKFLQGTGVIREKLIKSTRYVLDVKALTNSEIQVNTAYFPGWQVYVDSKETKTYKTKEGLFAFYLGKGRHLVQVKFSEIFVRKLGSFFSFVSIGFLILILFERPKHDFLKSDKMKR